MASYGDIEPSRRFYKVEGIRLVQLLPSCSTPINCECGVTGDCDNNPENCHEEDECWGAGGGGGHGLIDCGFGLGIDGEAMPGIHIRCTWHS